MPWLGHRPLLFIHRVALTAPSTSCHWSEVTQSCLTLGTPRDCCMPGFPVLQYLPEFAQTHVHWVDNAIQPSHPLSLPSTPALNLSQNQTLCSPMDCTLSRFPVLHCFLKFTQTHVHWVGDAIQPSHPLSPSSPPALNLSQHQALCIRWPKYWSFSISSFNEYSGLISFRIDSFDLLAVQGTFKSLLQHHSSKAWILYRLSHQGSPSRSKHLLISWLQSPYTVILEPRKVKSVTASTFSHSICHEGMGADAMIFVFWMLNFKTAFSLSFSPSSRGSLVPLHFLPLEWYHLHIWGCWYFS